MATTRVRLRQKAVFWTAAALVFAARQLVVLGAVLRMVPPRKRVAVLLLHPRATGASVVWGVVAGCAAVVVASLVVRWVVGPALRSWLSPEGDASEAHFHLRPGETLEQTAPARRRGRWPWEAGTLVRTDRRVWFIPRGWDGSPWSAPRGGPASARLVPSPLACRGVLEGVPDLLAVETEGEPPESFAVADPAAALAWFAPAASAAARP